jgi:2-keto-4-pentenoate hydratase/2-oxohepta-3-ene-1,7-dioic acid hydratase in catechol pathway
VSRYARLALADGAVRWVALEGEEAHALDRAPWLGGTRTGAVVEGRPLAPAEPSKILCVGRNYRAHAAELGNPLPAEPLLFLKPPSALLEPDGVLELPPAETSERVEHEVELALIVGRRLRRASLDEAAAGIFGLTIGCDVTARDLQKRDGQWTRAKGFDGFCPLGPVVATGCNASAIELSAHVNGERRQHGSTAAMVFSPAELLAYASAIMTLEPGDVVLTGTPEGVGPLRDGDAVVLEASGIGVLRFSVKATR